MQQKALGISADLPYPMLRKWFSSGSWRSREALTGWAFVLPAFIGFVVFYIVPSVRALYLSTTDWNLLSAPAGVGFANYLEMWNDDKFWRGLKLSLWYVLLNIPMQTLIGLFLAAAMDRLVKSMALRAIILLPYLLSSVLVAMMWLWLLDPFLGWVDASLIWLGITPQPFFGSPDQAMITVAIVNIWRHMGLISLLFLAGMQGIPRYLYEAAALDGASEWQMFRRITLPLLRPVMVFVLVTSVTGSFQIFDTVAVTTAGGPAESTQVIVYYIYQNAFSFYRMGYASAMSVVLALIMIGYTMLQMRVMRANQSDLA